MLNNIKTCIFDMDGTIVDSMWVWSRIDDDFLAQNNAIMTSEVKAKMEGLSFSRVAELFKTEFQLDMSIEDIMKSWNTMAMDKYSNEVKLKTGAREFFEYIHSKGIKMCIATSNSRELAMCCLKSHDIDKYFSVVLTGNDIKVGKDSPDIYLECAKKCNSKPSECIVFEDILPGVKAGKQAGMKVCAIYDDNSKNNEDEISKIADKYIHNYFELI